MWLLGLVSKDSLTQWQGSFYPGSSQEQLQAQTVLLWDRITKRILFLREQLQTSVLQTSTLLLFLYLLKSAAAFSGTTDKTVLNGHLL